MKKLLELVLKLLSQAIIAKYNPEVIAITGSVGKTTTKQAIGAVLATTYRVGTNLKNYNNEIGLPLSIIGKETGGRSIFKWLAVFIRALRLLVVKDKSYPDFLVLEFGADKPGDIKYLTQLVPVKTAVVTAVGPAHIEFFDSLDHIAEEKADIVKALSQTGYAVLNADNPRVLAMATQTQAQIITFGLTPNLKYSGSNLVLKQSDKLDGISFTVAAEGELIEVALPKVIGKHFVYSALAAIAVGRLYDLDFITITKALSQFETPNGRMKVLPGIKQTTLIDDSYNSSAPAAMEALKLLAEINFGKNKYAVLGDMLELGSLAQELHRQVGKAVHDNAIDYLITIGRLAHDIADGATAAGMSLGHIFSFNNNQEAGRFLQNRLASGDVMLIKGSQGARLERVVKEVMASPEKAQDLLVRQDQSWLK